MRDGLAIPCAIALFPGCSGYNKWPGNKATITIVTVSLLSLLRQMEGLETHYSVDKDRDNVTKLHIIICQKNNKDLKTVSIATKSMV